MDLGCGSGLYAERLVIAGVQVVGIDQSEAVLVYAMKQAEKRIC
ncbi:methyltransferase domain-containing protein [Desulfofarcimen acetoxidans]